MGYLLTDVRQSHPEGFVSPEYWFITQTIKFYLRASEAKRRSLNDLGLAFRFLARFPSGGKGENPYLYPVKMTSPKHISTEFQGGLPRMLRRSWQCADMDPDNVVLDEDFIINQTNDPENELYFYHTDHLGSSSWITDASGAVNQHIQYLPFGESFISQKVSSYDVRYKFTGKERDQETGYDYFGARYYASDLSVWLSVDPLASKYPSMSPYMYTAGNPVMLVDPDGRRFIDANGNRVKVRVKKDGTIKYKFKKGTSEIIKEDFYDNHAEVFKSLSKTNKGRKEINFMNRIKTIIKIIPNYGDYGDRNSVIIPIEDDLVFDPRYSQKVYKEVIIRPNMKKIAKTAKQQNSDFYEILGATMLVESLHLHPFQIQLDQNSNKNDNERYVELFNNYVRFRYDYRLNNKQKITPIIFKNNTNLDLPLDKDNLNKLIKIRR
jgi:RHS repeat-associated protein